MVSFNPGLPRCVRHQSKFLRWPCFTPREVCLTRAGASIALAFPLLYSKLGLIEGYDALNHGTRAELETLYPIVARLEGVIQWYDL